jgi:hypothetical protein
MGFLQPNVHVTMVLSNVYRNHHLPFQFFLVAEYICNAVHFTKYFIWLQIWRLEKVCVFREWPT